MTTRRPRGQVQADINVTPLVDVVLVLLIIFMVVTPMITDGPPVELPRTAHHDRKGQGDDGKDLTVAVTADSRVFLDANPVAVGELPRRIEEERRRAPGKLVSLKGDGRAPYSAMRAVMEAIHKASVEEVRLRTDQLEPPGR
jgi:biopolymer transport protein TolR